MLESTTVKVTAEDISTPVSTATELEEAPDHKITLTDVSETKFSQSTSEEETVKTTLTAVPVTTMKKTSTTEIPDKSAITHEEIITSESPSEMSVLTSTSQDVASTEEPFAFAITKKIPTTQESAETTIFDTTIAAEKPDKEISTEEIFTEERKTVTPFEEPSDISKQSSTFTTADAFKSTTGKQFSELETKTPTEVPEKFEIITTRRIFDESKLQTETATQAIDIKSTQTILTETPFDENAASLQPLTVTDFSTEKTLEDKLITQAKFKVTSAASTETLEEKTETVHTFDTTVPSAEIKTTTSKEITPPFSDESMTSEQLSSTVHFVTPKDISFEMTSSEETSTSKMPTSAEERTKATQESTSAAATEELDSGKQFSATMVETTGSPEALPEIISSKAFEISTTEAVIDDSKKITTDQAETFQSTETPESVIELTPSTTKIAVDTLETEILERKPQSTLKPLEDEVTITPIISEKEETDVTVQEGEEKESVETSSLLDELLTTSTTKVNITSEPISVVTESTSSTATTTAETVTETFTHLLDEVNVTLTEEKDVKSTTVVLSTKGIDEDDITSAEKSDCLINGTSYGDGESILTVEPCEKCHCATGEIICFKIICKVPKQGCIPVIFKDECCPTSYKCPTEEESTEIVTLSDSSSPTEKYITTPIPISFMFSTIPTSISTTILTSKPSDLEDEIKASTETGTEFSTSEKESSFTPETTVSTIKAFDEQTRLTAPERTSESIIGVTEKETSVSESISSLKTTPTITESSPSIIPLSTLNIFDESSNKTALKEESDVTVETLQSETTPKPTDAHKLKDFETTLSIVKASTEEKSIEPEVITESFKPSILTDKADEEITIATSTKAEKTPELTTKSSDISSSTITSFSSASTSHISVTEETSAVEPDITTKELPFETTTKFKDTETTPFVEKSESTAKAVTISETTKTSITRVEIDLVTTAASVLDEEVKPKYLSTVSESGTSTITSISSAVTSDEKSAEITTGVESDTRTDEVTPESLHISTKFDKFKGIETTALDEKITTKGKGTESEATSDVTESSVFTPEASKTSPSGEETKIKPAFTTLESNLSTISYESTDGDKFSETTTFDTTTKVVISDTTPESTDVEQVRGIETTVSDEKISTTRKSELSSETVATSESTQPLVSAIEADSFTKETFTKLDETRLEPTFTTVESGSTMFSSASSVTATDERKTETTSEKEHSSELTTYEDVQSVRDFETTTSTEKVTTEEKISETLLVSDVTESEAFTLEKVNATATPPMKSDVTLTPSESSLPTTTSLSFVPISDDEAAETSPVVEPTTELLTKMTPKSTEAEKQAETTLSEETMSTEVAIKETTITRESTGATVFSLETDNVTTLPSTLVDEIKLKPITLTSETATSPTITVPTMGISDEILKTTETVSEKFDSTPATEKDEFRVTVSEAEKVDKTESVITTSKTVGFPKLSDFTTMDSEESPKTQEISTSTSIPIKLPKLEDSVTSTVRIPTVEISTEKSESLFTTAKVHAINVSTDVTEEQTATMFPKETSQGMTTFESTKFDVDKITIEFTEKSESKAETTTLRDEFRTLGSKVTDGLRFDSTDITSTFTTSSPALSTEIEAKINDTAIAIDQERTPLPHTSISEMLNIGGISTMGPPLILTSDRTSIDITTTAITFKDEGIVTELRTAGTTQSERISDTSSPETESSEAFEPVTGSMQETTLFKTSTVPSEDRLETNTTTTMKSETSTDISQSTAFAETEISINITDDKKVAKTSVTDFTALRELTTKSLLDVTTYEDITSQEAESSESFETFTETAQVNQTVVSLSKERTPVFEDNVTDASLITELDVANKTFVTERSFTPVPEDVQKVKTTLQPRITTKSDETKPTDEIFNFVSTRFADVTKFTKSEDVDESKIPIGDDVEISRTPTDIQRKTTFADTSITEKETTTIFKQPVRSTTVSSETFDTEESLITSESPVIIPKESFTTKGPAIKSLEDVPTTPFSFENKTTTKVLLDELTTKPVSETAFSTGSTQLIAEEITTRESLGTSESETKIPKAEMTSEISGVVEFSTHIEELTTSIPRMISTLRDKLDIVTEGKIGIQEGAEVTTLFTEKPSLSTEGSLNETLTTEEKELTDILGTSLSSTTIEISKKFPDTSTQQSESTTIQQKIKTDLPSKSSVSDEEITELFEASVTTASQELETEVTSEKKDDQLLELTTTEVRVIEDEVSIHSTPTSIGTSLPSIETESSLSSKNATFTTLPDIKPDSMSTANITSVTDESDIEAKISTLTPLIKLDLSSTISSLISTTVEELSSSVKDHESSTAATIKPITLKEFEDVTVITKKTAVEDSASTLSPITPTMAEGETILFELNVTETTAPGVDKNQTAVADEEIVDNVTESFTKITQPSSESITDLTSRIPPEESTTQVVTESSTKRKTEPAILLSDQITTHSTQKLPESSTQMTEVSSQMTEQESQTTVGSVTDKSIEFSTQKAFESTTQKLMEPTSKSTELPTKAYKGIETTPLPITSTFSTIAGNVTDAAEDDYQLDEGACIFDGQIFQSAEQIVRADPCEFCFCFRGDIICLQQSCPPPAPNCHRTMIHGYCCPRYDCPVLVTARNISSFTRRKGVQPIIIQKRIEKRAIRAPVEVKGCQINGTFYEVGSTVTKASGPCLHCLCEGGGNMRCDPLKCKPQPPLMLKMNNGFFRTR